MVEEPGVWASLISFSEAERAASEEFSLLTDRLIAKDFGHSTGRLAAGELNS